MVARIGNGGGSELEETTIKWVQQAKRREWEHDILPLAWRCPQITYHAPEKTFIPNNLAFQDKP